MDGWMDGWTDGLGYLFFSCHQDLCQLAPENAIIGLSSSGNKCIQTSYERSHDELMNAHS
jgi:hypothetical protein